MENIVNNKLRGNTITGYEPIDSTAFLIVTDNGSFRYSFGELSIEGVTVKSFANLPFSKVNPIVTKLDISQIDVNTMTDEQLSILKQRLENLK